MAERRKLPPIAIGVLSVVIAGLGVAAILLATGEGQAHDHLGIRSEEFAERWDATVDELGGTSHLPEPAWEADEPTGLEVASHAIEDWALVELYRDPDGWMTAVLVTAQPRVDTHEDTFTHIATAAIASGLQVDAPTAAGLLREDLGAERTRAGALDERLVREGVAVILQREGGTWQMRVAATGAEEL